MTEFQQLVLAMRQAQRDYFAADHGSSEKRVALSRSKALEAQVDAALWKIDNAPVQTALFEEANA